MEWIDEIIEGLKERYGTTNVFELCDVLSIVVVKLEKENILLRKKDAIYDRCINGIETIFIRDDLHPIIEDFIIKHELGHALCHPDLLHAAYSFSNKGKLERQANYFALKLCNITFDEIELLEMTTEQIAAYLEIPHEPFKQLFSK